MVARLIFSLLVLFVGIGCGYEESKLTSESETIKGLAVCENEDKGIKGVSHRHYGHYWTYTYRGLEFSAGALAAVNPSSPVYHSDERILSENESIRTVTLRNNLGDTVISADVNCFGSMIWLHQILQ